METKNMDFFEMSHKWLHKTVINSFAKLKKHHDIKILDIWCWNGNMLKEIHSLWYCNLYGCDGFIENDKLLNIAKFQQINLTQPLPYDDNSFDVIFLTEVIEHMEYPNLLLKEVHRILSKHWIVIISTPNILNIPSRLLFLFTGHFLLFTEWDIKYDKFPWHIAPFLRYIFQEVFKEYFKIESKDYSNRVVPLLWTEIWIRHRLISNSIILTVRKI